MSTFWDPRTLLGINPSEPGFSCTAIATPKKKRDEPQEPPRRCLQDMLKNDHKDQACNALDALSRIDVISEGVSAGMKRALVLVAELTSCPRWHKDPARSQAEKVGAQWAEAVERFVVVEKAKRWRAAREEIRVASAAVPEARGEPQLFVQRGRERSVPNLEVPARRASERQQAPDVQPQHRPRRQSPPRQQSFHEQPIREPAPDMVSHYIPRERAALAAEAAQRRLARQQDDFARDHFVVRDRAPQPYPVPRLEVREQEDDNRGYEPPLYPAPQPEIRAEPEVNNRRREPALNPAPILRSRSPERENRQLEPRPDLRNAPAGNHRPVLGPIARPGVADFQAALGRLLQEHAHLFEAGPAEVQPPPPAPIIPAPNQVQGQEDAAVERANSPPPDVQPVAAVLAQPYAPRRQPIEQCYICDEDFDNPVDVIWCMDQCGQNVHRGCFEAWNRVSLLRRRRCAFCRTPWVEQP